MRFTRFACIDWSGAAGARQKGIAVAACEAGSSAPELVRPGHLWSRADLLDWLAALEGDWLVGLDLSPALPFVDYGAYFPGWSRSPPDAKALWKLVDGISTDDPHLSVSSFVHHPDAARYFRRRGLPLGDRFGPERRGRFRVVEHHQRQQSLSPYSCFNLVGAAQVGKSSLTGMRVLHRLTGAVPIWPFDPDPGRGPLIVEIYTSIAARGAGIRAGLSKIRDAASLDTALAALGSKPHRPLSRYDDHSTDAIVTAAWLRHAADDHTLWHPPALTTDLAQTEGWTFGVR